MKHSNHLYGKLFLGSLFLCLGCYGNSILDQNLHSLTGLQAGLNLSLGNHRLDLFNIHIVFLSHCLVLGSQVLFGHGDGINDLPMFEIADECYAVSNAVDELKAIATGVIESNNADGIAKWLSKHVIL